MRGDDQFKQVTGNADPYPVHPHVRGDDSFCPVTGHELSVGSPHVRGDDTGIMVKFQEEQISERPSKSITSLLVSP